MLLLRNPLCQTNERAVPDGTARPRHPTSLTRFLVLDLGELRIDDVAVVLLAGFGACARLALLRLLLRLLLGVHLLAQLLRRLRERLLLGVDLGLVLGLERALGVLHRGLDLFLLAG